MPKSGPRWHRELAHEHCTQCTRAADAAKSEAIVRGSTGCTWTEGEHWGKVSRPATRTSE